jgi:hypothetical protein
LKTRGFVCYFAGTEDLWRITDCWQDYYNEKHWGRIVCVSAHHPDVKGLVDRMEQIFNETLKKSQTFGKQ